MNNSVIFFGRENCYYSNKILNLLKKKFKNVYYFKSKTYGEKFNFKKIKNIDYIFCFRSLYILKKELLEKVNKFSVNFHPGTTRYRGIGCLNFALYENSKNYGSTAHIINQKIDNGKILDVKTFKINKNDNVEKLLKKTHKAMFNQAKKIIKKISHNDDYINLLLKKKNHHIWSKKIYKRKTLNKMRIINKNISTKELERRIRAFSFKNFKLLIKINNRIFSLND